MTLIDRNGESVEIKAQAREVYDVSGASDTVVATMAAALAVEVPLIDAARTANLAASIVVGKLGTKPILASELSTAMAFNDSHISFHTLPPK